MKLYATEETTYKGATIYKNQDFEYIVNYKGAKFGATVEELKRKMDFADYTETAFNILKSDGYLSAKIYINDLRRGRDITKEQADELSKKIILSKEFDGVKTI